MSKDHLKLGTRRSLLAKAQSLWVKSELEQIHPNLVVELVEIETRGDQIQNIPLSQMEGKDFFVAELDQALLDRRVDFNVHSMKDLSLERPKAFASTFIPKRANPRDVVLFSPFAHKNLSSGKTLKIGSSSPRRIENVSKFLEQALPSIKNSSVKKVQMIEIRGNVNTRLQRVNEPETSERYLDGVVLAFAGLIRLWADRNGRLALTDLLKNVKWMVLPLEQNPTAAAQGALAIECLEQNERAKGILKSIHDEKTKHLVQKERNLLEKWGGGCHQRFGATAINVPFIGEVLFVRGIKPDGSSISETTYQIPRAENKTLAWHGRLQKFDQKPKPTNEIIDSFFYTLGKSGQGKQPSIFVAHKNALCDELFLELDNRGYKPRIWVSGVKSWFALASKGIWVEGCAEGVGFDWLSNEIYSEVLCSEPPDKWIALTHEHAAHKWMHSVITYESIAQTDPNVLEKLSQATHVYWSSSQQFDALQSKAISVKEHACGPGKTARHIAKQLKERNQEDKLRVFLTPEDWKKWIGYED
ncbi:MAG: hydroxymethylbilane synthase [Bacteriovoracia bacterium]